MKMQLLLVVSEYFFEHFSTTSPTFFFHWKTLLKTYFF